MKGRGIWKHPDGAKYDGEWKDGKINGRGIFTDTDGATYDGEWKDGKNNGRGIFTDTDGRKTLQVYNEGELVSEQSMT